MSASDLQPVSLGGLASATLASEISISTWNVWFDKLGRDDRFRAILEILRQHDPDIMAFQEVTPPFVRAVQDTEWLKQRHWISAVDHNNLGTVLVSRVQPTKLTWTELPTKMGRRLLTVDFPRGLRVGVCHLESLANEALRKEQMHTAFTILKQSPKAIMLGDFNFSDEDPEATCIDLDFSDAWPAAHPGSLGHTRDTVANPMGRFGREDKKERLDRVLLRGLKLETITMLGMEPIKEGLYPSDHFGLLARVSL